MTLTLRLAPRALAAAFAAVLASGASSPALADPFTVDDLLRNESFGSVRISPDEQTILFERQGPHDTADRFDLGYFSRWTTSVVWRADRGPLADPRPWLAAGDGRGVVLGEFSPSGRRIVVHRLQHDRWETGVAETTTGAVRWLGLGAEPPVKGETVVWRSEDELILVARVDGDLPYEIGAVATAARRTRDERAIAAGGGVATTVWGAGAFIEAEGHAAIVRTWRIDLRSGRRTLLAEGRTLDLALSPDARWLAVVDRGPPYAIDLEAPFRPGEQTEPRKLRILDLEGGPPWSPCEDCDIAGGLLAWSADGRLLVWDRAASGPATAGRLLTLSPGDRRMTTLDTGDVEPEVGATRDTGFQSARAAWLGAHPVLLARLPGEARTDWYEVGGAVINLTRDLPQPPGSLEAVSGSHFLTIADGAVWVVDETGRASRLPGSSGVTAVSTLTHWASPRRRLNTPPARNWTVGRASDGTLWRLSPDRSPVRISGETGGGLRAVAETMAVDRVVQNGVETLRLIDAHSPPRPLAVVNAAYGRVEFAQPQPVFTPGAPEGSRDSWLYAPPGGLRPGTPVIIVAYPGASVSPREPAEFFTMANVQLLAGLGYAVLTPALPGTGIDGPAAHLTDRILATLDAALSQYPNLDGDRVGYIGHSFGGYTGLVLATQSRRIRSFIVLSAPANLSSAWGGFAGYARANTEFGHVTLRRAAGWSETGQGAMGGSPWADPSAYVDNSPFFRTDRIQAPLLLVHGELDFVPVTEPESLFTALWRQNKDVELVTYWGEQHLFYSPGNVRDLWGRIDAWLARTVGLSPARLTPPPSFSPTGGPRPPETQEPESPMLRPASAGHPHPAVLPDRAGR